MPPERTDSLYSLVVHVYGGSLLIVVQRRCCQVGNYTKTTKTCNVGVFAAHLSTPDLIVVHDESTYLQDVTSFAIVQDPYLMVSTHYTEILLLCFRRLQQNA